MNRYVTLASMTLVVAVVALTVGCEKKLTYKRWGLIHDGQSKLGVEKTLGDPLIKMSDHWTWNDSDRAITAQVWYSAEGKVIAKQWFDPKRQMRGGPPGGSAGGSGEVVEERTRIMVVE